MTLLKKKLFSLCLLLLASLSAVAQTREKQLINFDWKFSLGDITEASSTTFNDAKWQTVNLPHDASIYGAFVNDTLGGTRRNGYRPRHIGWYRKHISVPKLQEGKRYILEFESVYRESDVWVNGVHCGKFLNGYMDFEYDITQLLKPGENIIAVRYDNTYKDSSRWYTGEGITRDVYLHIVDNVHVSRYGTYITTPKISKEQATVSVQTNVYNQEKDSVLCKLITEIKAPSGKVAGTATSVVPLGSNDTFCYKQDIKITNPDIWDIRSPQLYTAVSKVYNNDTLVDVYETTFGIREVEFNPEQGFVLNGKKVLLKGVCLHHDLGPLGAASFEAAWNKRLTIIKNDLGCNAIRLTHNPYPKYVLDWCDKNGILVFDEAYDKWEGQYYGPDNKFADYWKNDLENFIKRDRNHPSVFIWSVGNEVVEQQQNDTKSVEQSIAILIEMLAFVNTLEPTRKITCGLYPARYNGVKYSDKGYYEAAPHQMAYNMDVMSVNYQSGFFKKDHEKYPQLIFLTSEMATEDAGYGYFGYDHTYSCGQFYWGGTEYIGESFGWPSKGWINGAIDLTNRFKPVAYSIKSFYSEKPMLQIAVLDKDKMESKIWNDAKISWKPKYFHWNWNKGEKLTVQTFTNCDSVALYINGIAQGVKTLRKGEKPEMLWQVDYQPGTIEAKGYKNGKLLSQSKLQTAGKAHKIVLESDRRNISADGLDLAYITAKVVDKNGVTVPGAHNLITFKVKGEGTNAGVGNGDINSNELWQAGSRSVFQGECQLIVRSTQKSGNIEIRATSAGLKSDKLVLTTNNN